MEEDGDLKNPEDIFISLDNAKNKKRLSIERIYQRKTQLEHILLRPDTYVGSVEEAQEQMYVYDEEKAAITRRSVTFVPGLYKIFDEILVNAADNKQRDKNMNTMKIVINQEENLISVWNNGRGIPVQMHAVEKMYVPELIFGTLLTSSNYNDSQRKVTGGRNGYGAKLCNIFSSQFTVETSCSESQKSFKMTWTENMGKSGKTIVKDAKGSDFTKVSFKPDLAKFGMTHLTKDMAEVMAKRVYDMAGCIKGVSVHLNGKRISLKSFKDYVELYVKGVAAADEEDEGLSRKVVHEIVNPRWEVAVTASPAGSFQQASFVNSIATTKGGTHVTYIVDQIVAKLLEVAKRKNKGGMDLKPAHVKSHLWVFVNCLIENPSFDSQTKENMTLKAKSFGSTCALSEKFIKAATSCGVVERVLNWARAKSQAQISKKQSGSKSSKMRGIAKLDDANDAGGKNSLDCTLIVTEGDSAKTLAVSGLGIIGRDQYGVFPLRGKLLNVRDATHNQIMGNEEVKNMVKILGLQYGRKYADSAELKTLRYGHLMIMADQDQDGSHIKGLVINFIHHNWPRLLQHNFVEEFITPIVKVTKGRQEKAFYSLPEFEQWKAETEAHHTWRAKYYKGLGTSTAKEAKEYFSDMERHRIPFKYGGPSDDDAIQLAFSKKQSDRRKEWLTSWLEEKKEKRESGVNESFLYGEQTNSLTFSDFINKELILFSNADNERSIPSMVDGLKPGQRKVLFTCFKRNDRREVKVAQLAGSIAELSAYHHGEASLMSTIINLAQNFVGSNNINLLQPIGQFGTRLHGGKDAASPRYIFTKLSSLTRMIFPPNDDPQLHHLREDNMRIEPEWYCPIIPLVLVNGSEGIGTGYSTFVPNFDVREIVANIKRLMNDMEPLAMSPCYKNFTGTIVHTEPCRHAVYGHIARLSPTSVEVTELPIRTWTQSYKENVLEAMLHGSEKVQPSITDYKEYHTDTTVRFVISMHQDKMKEADLTGFHKKFKLESSLTTSNMVLFDRDGCLRRFSNAEEILNDFYTLRLEMYNKRMDYLMGMLSAESAKLANQARFIVEFIENKIDIKNKRKVDAISHLKAHGYRSDPVKSWKESLASQDEEEEEGGSELEGAELEVEQGDDYNYLLSMALWSLTREKKEELLKNRDAKIEELRILKEKTPKDLWREDLETFMAELDRVEAVERSEEAEGSKIAVKTTKKKGKSSGRQTKLPTGQNSLKHTKPSPFAEKIDPIIPAFNANPKKASAARLKKVKSASESSPIEIKGKGKVAKQKGAAKAITADSFFSDEDSDGDLPDLASRLDARRRVVPEVKGHEDDDADVSIDEFPSADPITIDSGSESDFVSAPKRSRVKASTSAEPKKVSAAAKKKKAPSSTTSVVGKKKQVSAKAGIGSKSIIKAKDGQSQSTLKIFATRGKKRALEVIEDDSGKDSSPTKKTKTKPTKKSKSKVQFSDDEDISDHFDIDDDDDDDNSSIVEFGVVKKVPSTKKVAVKKVPAKKKVPVKQVVKDNSDDEYDSASSDAWDGVITAKSSTSTTTQRSVRQRAKVTYFDDDDDEEEDEEN